MQIVDAEGHGIHGIPCPRINTGSGTGLALRFSEDKFSSDSSEVPDQTGAKDYQGTDVGPKPAHPRATTNFSSG